MNEQQIRQALEVLAQEEVTDNMDLWTTIKAQIETPNRVQTQRLFRFGRLILVVAICLISAVVYAIYQSSNSDPGLISVADKQLVTPLNMSQTVNGITVNLNWGYADSNRILLAYTIIESDGVNAYASPDGGFTLVDSNGNYFINDATLGLGGLKVAAETNMMASGFDSSCLAANEPDKLNLTLNLTLIIGQTTGASNQGGGGGGGGGSTGCLQASNVSPSSPPVGQKSAHFSFQFDLPMIHAVKISNQQSLSSNGIQMSVNSVVVTPSMTRLTICYTLPDESMDWSPYGFELIDENKVPLQNYSLETNAAENCSTVSIPAPYLPGKTTEMTLNITELRTSYNFSPDGGPAFMSRLAKQGVKIEITGFGEGLNYNIVTKPENMTDDELSGYISDAMDQAFRRHHPGSWVFTFKLP